MKTAKWIIGIVATLALAFYILVEKKVFDTNDDTRETNTPKAQVVKRYNDDGSLKADVEIIDGVRHGVAHNYYSDGSVHSAIQYKNGEKHGTSTWYYGDGKPYRITTYQKGKKHGTQKKYYKNGHLMAEIPYLNNELQPGTKEYTETGKLVSQTTNFTYTTENKLQQNNIYLISVKGKEINDITKYVAFNINGNKKQTFAAARNDNTITFHIPKASIANNRTIQIWLYSKTKMNNKIIFDKQLEI